MNKNTMIFLQIIGLIIVFFVGVSLGGYFVCTPSGGTWNVWERSCTYPEPSTPQESIDDEEEDDEDEELVTHPLIEVDSPQAGDMISSPLTITGEAKGYWYFEASFPVEITDSLGNMVAQHYATALSDWMTEDFVPFSSTITFTPPSDPNGFLILRKDNPSGLPANDDEIVIPIQFAP